MNTVQKPVSNVLYYIRINIIRINWNFQFQSFIMKILKSETIF